ncbi:MAG TPA: N-acetyltransferase, partial [Phycisphaerae bacterium]|nr:N-acetyltransferase [Phycisphaerae bacterium]
VAEEEDGRLVGYIMLTRMYVHGDDGKKYPTLLIAPLAVAIEYRDKGIGSALVKESLWAAAELDYRSVFLVGDPKYYKKLGFRAARKFGITHPGIPAEYVMACELSPDALKGIHGTVDCRGLDE